MVFLRTKRINRHHYCYLVENHHTKNGPRQKVKKYLGKAIRLEKTRETPFPSPVPFLLPAQTSKTELLRSLIAWELKQHNFREKNYFLTNKDITFNRQTFQLKKQNKDIVLQLNEGFLSEFTLKRLLNFKKTNDLKQDAPQFAKYFVEAGINIPQEVFITCYQKW